MQKGKGTQSYNINENYDYNYWYKKVYDSNHVGLFRSKISNGKVIDCNQHLANMLGYTSKQDCIDHYIASSHYTDKSLREKLLKEIVQNKSIDNYLVCLTKTDGKPLYLNLTAHINAEIKCLEGIVQDVTPTIELQMFQKVINILSKINLETEQDFFSKLVEILSIELGASCVCIGELDKSKSTVTTTAIILNGEVKKNYTYELTGTPCENAIYVSGCYYPEKVQELFPLDADLQKLSAQCYAGTPISNQEGEVKGILFIVGDKPFKFDAIILTLLSIFAEKAYSEMERIEKEKNKLLMWKQTVRAFSRALEMRDPYTSGHQNRTAVLAVKISEEMNLDKKTTEGIELAAIIHDAGKMCVPAEFLTRPGKLTSCEFAVIKNHALIGYEIFKNIHFPWPIAEIVYQHHERMDGSGYPQGLKGKEIRLEAQIIAVADVVEAMSTDRPYRLAPGLEAAVEEIQRNKGVKYNNKVVDAFLKVIKTGFTFDLD